jgi:hypothetical protein
MDFKFTSASRDEGEQVVTALRAASMPNCTIY